MDIRRILIFTGAILVIVGFAWPFISRLGLGRLPGDIVVQRANFRFYFPIVTSLLASVLVTLLLWLFRR